MSRAELSGRDPAVVDVAAPRQAALGVELASDRDVAAVRVPRKSDRARRSVVNVEPSTGS